jgi:hypothetical protein
MKECYLVSKNNDFKYLRDIFGDKYECKINKAGNINVYIDEDNFWTLGKSDTHGYVIRKTKIMHDCVENYPTYMRPYFLKEKWSIRFQSPLHYNRRTRNYGFDSEFEMLMYFEKYLKKYYL